MLVKEGPFVKPDTACLNPGNISNARKPRGSIRAVHSLVERVLLPDSAHCDLLETTPGIRIDAFCNNPSREDPGRVATFIPFFENVRILLIFHLSSVAQTSARNAGFQSVSIYVLLA